MEKVIAENRKARHDYFLEDFYEAGIALTGTEIKSVRKGAVQFKDAYIDFVNNEAFIRDMHISQYKEGNIFNHEETRLRKLLLHKREINKLSGKCRTQGYTVVPLKLYFKDGRVKMEIALAKGKSLYDKRLSDKQRTMERVAKQALRR